MDFIATAGYGLEGIAAQELKHLGLTVTDIQSTRAQFTGTALDACRANLWLRTAGHIALVIGKFEAKTFDALFDAVRALAWEDYLPADAKFPITARCVSSQLMSVPDCQRLVKKAVADRLCSRYHQLRCPESGTEYPLECHIYKDAVTLSLNLSGAPLHMRGYRKLNGPAALRETLAAAMVLLSHWRSERIFADPCCGTGTLLVEAALLGRNIAPGLNRSFGGEQYAFLPPELWGQARQEARDLAQRQAHLEILGSDIDPEALSMAQYHAKAARVADAIRFSSADAARFRHDGAHGVLVTNPPYGVRMSDQQNARRLASDLGRQYRALDAWSCHVISPDEGFEQAFGRKADKKRPLYNGPLRCKYYQYFRNE